MKKMKSIGIVFLLLCLSTVSLNAWALQPYQIKTIEQMNAELDHLFGSHDEYHAFFDQLKQDIAQENKKAVATVVNYPLKVDINKKRVLIKNQRQFIQNYDLIITPKIRKAVADQQFIGMFLNYRGMMFGNGQIWFSGICLDKTCKHVIVRITGVNN